MRIRPSSFRKRPKTTAEVDAEKGRIERDEIREREREREREEEHKSRLVVVASSLCGWLAGLQT